MGLKYGQSKRLLIVEDSLLQSLVIERTVKKLGYEVVGKLTSGEEALRSYQHLCPDCLILDISLTRQLNGYELAKNIREHAKIPVIFITGVSKSIVPNSYLKKGYTEIIAKPFTSEDLMGILERIFHTELSR